ncbi:MAG TPA: NAD(P)/FAD-dependent oxidoreductase [bacterium]|nr:NAD(P)/FAD-dependent oxidoreductase [bacterium]
MVIVGGGFAGLWAVRALARAPVDVLLVDRRNYHTFLPLLYQVAASEVEPEAIAYPIRSILRAIPNGRFLMAEVETLDPAARLLVTTAGRISYDALILAVGSVPQYFDLPGAREFAFPLKTLEEGVALRNHILSCFERAAHAATAAARRAALTFVIIGGGPTGVEFAGALAELVWGPLRRDHPTFRPDEVRVVLIEAMAALLPGLPERLSHYAAARLRRMRVDVYLGAAVTRVTPAEVALADGTVIPTETVVWTAGVRGDPRAEAWGLPVRRGGRVGVLPTLQVPGHPEVYVAGDLAFVERDGRPLPQIAPVAIQ